MHPTTEALSMFFGSALVIILIFAEFYSEYMNRYSSERRQKKLFCSILIISFVFLAVDTIITLIVGLLPWIIPFMINLLAALLALCTLIVFRKSYRKVVLAVVFAIAVLYVVGLCIAQTGGLYMDVLVGPTKLIWPYLSTLLLYTYFTIGQNETKLDTLTGLGNRNSFFGFINGLAHSKSESSWIFVMLDIDNIRMINNTYGHLEGDNVLRQFSGVLKNCIRDTDFAARYGGPKFIIATKVENGVEDLLKKLKEELAKHNEKSQKPYKIEISYGFDMFNAETGKHVEEFLTHLDTLMRKQKQDHRRTGDDHTGEEKKS